MIDIYTFLVPHRPSYFLLSHIIQAQAQATVTSSYLTKKNLFQIGFHFSDSSNIATGSATT